MTITVVGMWHLGCVTAACVAEAGHDVIAYDPDSVRIEKLKNNNIPIEEPGLKELTQQQQQKGKLHFTSNPKDISNSDLIWISCDTPVDKDDNADIEHVINMVVNLFDYIKDDTTILISSQMAVGSTKRLEELWKQKGKAKNVTFGYSPENLRLGQAIKCFKEADRIIVGVRNKDDKAKLTPILSSFTKNIIWMSVEAAEITKHAINAFLATSVVFINELAQLCEEIGCDATEVEIGLKSEPRIGPKAYVKPGAAFAGGTLARDLSFLINKFTEYNLNPSFFTSIKQSNEEHRMWAVKRLKHIIPNLNGKKIAVLGLTYKPGTNTLRSSSSIEMCRQLSQLGAKIHAHDPSITHLPDEYSTFITLETYIEQTIKDADALIIATPWPSFKKIIGVDVISLMNHPNILDAGSFIQEITENQPEINYITVGAGR